MSVEGDNVEHEASTEDTQERILEQLILLNARFEAQFDTGIDLEDVKYGIAELII